MFLTWKQKIEYDDQLVVFSTPSVASIIKITMDGIFCNKYGQFKHCEMVGKKYGSKIPSSTGKGFVYLLHPTPELWTKFLPHRTQILYQADISLITTFLGLRPGVKMIESGTGSGSFSHSIARSIFPTGRLYTFEYHSERAQKAKLEFNEHGLADVITVECKDVCKDGFGIIQLVSAVFLDLPSPWEAIPHTVPCFDPTRVGRICCYSPCIEQVQRTCKALNESGFVVIESQDIEMYETLQRPFEVTEIHTRRWTQPLKAGQSTKKRSAECIEEETVDDGMTRNIVSRPANTIRGHTSYLTFAKFIPQ